MVLTGKINNTALWTPKRGVATNGERAVYLFSLSVGESMIHFTVIEDVMLGSVLACCLGSYDTDW